MSLEAIPGSGPEGTILLRDAKDFVRLKRAIVVGKAIKLADERQDPKAAEKDLIVERASQVKNRDRIAISQILIAVRDMCLNSLSMIGGSKRGSPWMW